MENKLKSMFEFQKFAGNSRLAQMIAETESRYGEEIADDDLFLVNAAGDLSQLTKKDDDEE